MSDIWLHYQIVSNKAIGLPHALFENLEFDLWPKGTNCITDVHSKNEPTV